MPNFHLDSALQHIPASPQSRGKGRFTSTRCPDVIRILSAERKVSAPSVCSTALSLSHEFLLSHERSQQRSSAGLHSPATASTRVLAYAEPRSCMPTLHIPPRKKLLPSPTPYRFLQTLSLPLFPIKRVLSLPREINLSKRTQSLTLFTSAASANVMIASSHHRPFNRIRLSPLQPFRWVPRLQEKILRDPPFGGNRTHFPSFPGKPCVIDFFRELSWIAIDRKRLEMFSQKQPSQRPLLVLASVTFVGLHFGMVGLQTSSTH